MILGLFFYTSNVQPHDKIAQMFSRSVTYTVTQLFKVAVTAKLLIDTWIYKIHKTQNKECTELYAVSRFSTTTTLLP